MKYNFVISGDMRVGNDTSHARLADFSEGIEAYLACSLVFNRGFAAVENKKSLSQQGEA